MSMADYPKFSFDKCRIPPLSPEIAERAKEYERRMLRYVALPDPYAPSMSFEKFKEVWGKDRSVITIDEPTHIKQRLKGSINPAEEPLWVKAFKEWIKERQLWQ